MLSHLRTQYLKTESMNRCNAIASYWQPLVMRDFDAQSLILLPLSRFDESAWQLPQTKKLIAVRLPCATPIAHQVRLRAQTLYRTVVSYFIVHLMKSILIVPKHALVNVRNVFKMHADKKLRLVCRLCCVLSALCCHIFVIIKHILLLEWRFNGAVAMACYCYHATDIIHSA